MPNINFLKRKREKGYDKMKESEVEKSPVIYIVLAWLFVSIPLMWGIYQVVLRSLPLFAGS